MAIFLKVIFRQPKVLRDIVPFPRFRHHSKTCCK